MHKKGIQKNTLQNNDAIQAIGGIFKMFILGILATLFFCLFIYGANTLLEFSPSRIIIAALILLIFWFVGAETGFTIGQENMKKTVLLNLVTNFYGLSKYGTVDSTIPTEDLLFAPKELSKNNKKYIATIDDDGRLIIIPEDK